MRYYNNNNKYQVALKWQASSVERNKKKTVDKWRV